MRHQLPETLLGGREPGERPNLGFELLQDEGGPPPEQVLREVNVSVEVISHVEDLVAG